MEQTVTAKQLTLLHTIPENILGYSETEKTLGRLMCQPRNCNTATHTVHLAEMAVRQCLNC
jgi:hypothetical protein